MPLYLAAYLYTEYISNTIVGIHYCAGLDCCNSWQHAHNGCTAHLTCYTGDALTDVPSEPPKTGGS